MFGLFPCGKLGDQRVVSRVLAPANGLIGRTLTAASSYSRASCMCTSVELHEGIRVKVVPVSIRFSHSDFRWLVAGTFIPNLPLCCFAYHYWGGAGSSGTGRVSHGGLRTGFSSSLGEPERQEALLDRPGAGLQHCRFQSQHILPILPYCIQCLCAVQVAGRIRGLTSQETHGGTWTFEVPRTMTAKPAE